MSSQTGDQGVAARIESLAQRLGTLRSSRRGEILFTVSGSESGQYAVDTSPGSAQFRAGAARGDSPPLFEVIADSDTLRAVLDGEVDVRQQYFKGGLRVRGDLRHVSDVAMELGYLEHPL
jgi:hypothetical protein